MYAYIFLIPLKQPTFKTLALEQGLNTAEGVVLHAFWQKTRGRKPSLPYRGERNPFKALEMAKEYSGLDFNGNDLRFVFWKDIDFKEDDNS